MCVRGVGGTCYSIVGVSSLFYQTQQWEPVRGQRWVDEEGTYYSLSSVGLR